MAVETGLNWVFAIDTAESEGSPSWSDLPQQRGGGISFKKTDVDATNKDQSGWEHMVSTRRGWSASVDGVVSDNDTALQYLIDTNALHASAVDKPIHIKLTNAAGDTWIGWATMDELSIEAPENDLVSYSISFTGRAQDNTGADAPITLTRAA